MNFLFYERVGLGVESVWVDRDVCYIQITPTHTYPPTPTLEKKDYCINGISEKVIFSCMIQFIA